MAEILLATEGLMKAYRSGDRELVVLDQVSFSVGQGTRLAVMGQPPQAARGWCIIRAAHEDGRSAHKLQWC